jgi:RNA polymerase sigma factor (TIGR02999 family)
MIRPMSTPLDQDASALFERLYAELKRIARRQLDGGGHTLQTTGLVHEAWLKLGPAEVAVCSEAHLLNLASRAMRQIVVDTARRRAAEKRGGGALRVTLTGSIEGDGGNQDVDVLSIEQSLQRLEQLEPRLAQVVELHFFGGLQFAEISRVLGVTERTLYRDWRTARALILADLGGTPA